MPDLGSTCIGLWTVGNNLFVGFSSTTKALDLLLLTEVTMEALGLASERSYAVGGQSSRLFQVTQNAFLDSYGLRFNLQEHAVAAAFGIGHCAVSLINKRKE